MESTEEMKMNEEPLSEVDRLFKSLDKNKDGLLDQNDLAAVVSDLKLNTTEEKLKTIFLHFKPASSSKAALTISQEEFKYWWHHMRDTSSLEFIAYYQAKAFSFASLLKTISLFDRQGPIACSEYENDLATGQFRVATGALLDSYKTSLKFGLEMSRADNKKNAELLEKLGLKPEENTILLIKLKLKPEAQKDQAGTQTAFQALMKSVVIVAQSLNKTAKELLKLVTLTYKVHENCAFIIVKPNESLRNNLYDLYKLIEQHLNNFQTEENVVFELSTSCGFEQFIEKLQGSPNDALKALLGHAKLEITGFIRKIFQRVFQEIKNSPEEFPEELVEGASLMEDSFLLSLMLQSLKVDILADDPTPIILEKEEIMMLILQASAMASQEKIKLPAIPILKKIYDFTEKYLEGGLAVQLLVDRIGIGLDVSVSDFIRAFMKFFTF